MTEARQLYDALSALFRDYPRVKIKVTQTLGTIIEVIVTNTKSVPDYVLLDFITRLQYFPFSGSYYLDVDYYDFKVNGFLGNPIHIWSMGEIEKAINYRPHFFESTCWFASGLIKHS